MTWHRVQCGGVGKASRFVVIERVAKRVSIRKDKTMKKTRYSLLLGVAAAALLIGLPTLGTQVARADPPAAQSTQAIGLPADLQKIFNNLPVDVQRALRPLSLSELTRGLLSLQLYEGAVHLVGNPDELLKTLSPEAQSALNRLTPEEKLKAIPNIQQAIRITLARPEIKHQLLSMSGEEESETLRGVMSGAAYNIADTKYNGCNIMLDAEGQIAYDEAGVKKLAATPHACPLGVNLKTTLKYVNQILACAIEDPAYTRVMLPDEYSDMRKQNAGTKAAFDGAGVGISLEQDPAGAKLPPTADQVKAYKHNLLVRQKMIDHPETVCAGKPQELTVTERAELDELLEKPYQPAFTGMILHVIKGSPAEKAGFLDGDIVVKVNDEVVTGQAADSVIDKMRGKIGTQVTITVKRGDSEISRTMTREVVLPQNVWSRDLGNGIYAIVITDFERNNTAFEIYDEINKIGSKARGYVFDVRNNPGGILDEAVETVSLFVHDGVILSQRERIEGDPANPHYLKITWSRAGSHMLRETVDETSGKVTESGIMTMFETDDKTGEMKRSFNDIPFLGDKPMVVLANDHSASAAEIFTGGMGENHVAAGGNTTPQGATFIGVHTFGKFIGQTVMPGPAGTAIKATSFRYFSPRGEWLGDAWKVKIGLTPEIRVEEPKTAMLYTPSDVQLNAAIAYLLKATTGASTAGTLIRSPSGHG
jgi:C-terminal peptidase prc